jgi:putative inorganic carbon (hco3(-)) transporter
VDRRCRIFTVAEILLMGLLLPIVLFPSPTRFLALLLIPLFWLLRRLLCRTLLPLTPLNGALLLLLLMVLVTVLITPDLLWSLPKVAGVVYGVALYFAAVSAIQLSPRLFWAGTGLLLLAGMGVAAAGLLGMSASGKLPLVQPLVSRLPALRLAGGDLINPNEVAGVLLWMAPLALALALVLILRWRQRLAHPLLALLLIAVALVLAGALLLSQSRGGLLGYGVALFFLLAAFAGRYRRLLFGLLAGLLLFALVAYAVAPQRFEPLFDSGAALDAGEAALNSLAGRREIWSRARYVVEDFPFTGVGLNNFRRVVPLLYPLFLISPATDIAHAHNHLLQVATELGIPGLIAYLAVWIGAAAMLWQSWQRAPDPRLRAAAAGMAASLLAYFVYGMFDAVALGARPGFLFWLLLGLVAALYRQTGVAAPAPAPE